MVWAWETQSSRRVGLVAVYARIGDLDLVLGRLRRRVVQRHVDVRSSRLAPFRNGPHSPGAGKLRVR